MLRGLGNGSGQAAWPFRWSSNGLQAVVNAVTSFGRGAFDKMSILLLQEAPNTNTAFLLVVVCLSVADCVL